MRKKEQNGNKIEISGNNNSISKVDQIINVPSEEKLDTKLNPICKSSLFKKQVIELVSENLLGEALLLLRAKRPDLEKSCVLLSGRLYTLKLDIINGTLSNDESRLEMNKIASSIIDLIE